MYLKVKTIFSHTTVFSSIRLCVFLMLVGAGNASATTISDDFSGDSGLWNYRGNAYRDAANQYVVLTRPVNSQVGQVLLKQSFADNFVAKFRYRAGGGSGADGLAMLFYKNLNYTPLGGGCLGFGSVSSIPNCSSPGYGVEFDNWYNGNINDPSGNHIALLKDRIGNHLIQSYDSRTEDFMWHDVEVNVTDTQITVSVDGGNVWSWSGPIDRSYAGFGLTAATGAANNWHIIDDVQINIVPISANIDIKPGSYPNCVNNNGNGVIPVAVFGSASLDVNDINPQTLELEGLMVKQTGKNNKLLVHHDDVNYDGYGDLVVQFADSAGAFDINATTATLTAELYNSRHIEGSDSICLVP